MEKRTIPEEANEEQLHTTTMVAQVDVLNSENMNNLQCYSTFGLEQSWGNVPYFFQTRKRQIELVDGV